VVLERLETLWLNTGTLCNLTCKSCYIESSPTNNALVYLSLAEAEAYLDEAERLGTREIGFTGGEPFMNRDMLPMIRSALERDAADAPVRRRFEGASARAADNARQPRSS
jgi:MoaA/NifB/PqqE/SkfB family radical SAM enzyme